MNKPNYRCNECGGETDSELDACEGAMQEERSQDVNLSVTGTQNLMSCNCCETCRKKCLESWHELNDEENERQSP